MNAGDPMGKREAEELQVAAVPQMLEPKKGEMDLSNLVPTRAWEHHIPPSR